MLKERVEELKGEFSELKEPFQRYSLLLQLSVYAPECPGDITKEENKFPGCQTNVWLYMEWKEGAPNIQITSDSMLLRGVGFILMRLLNGLPLEEYRDLSTWDIPAAMGLTDMFTDQRQQGIRKLLSEIEFRVQQKLAGKQETDPSA